MKSGKFDGADRHRLWAELRFSVIGHLLASPPGKGELKICLEDLATRSWIHPIRREPTLFGMSTIEAHNERGCVLTPSHASFLGNRTSRPLFRTGSIEG